jgi:hypothetical protein
MILGKRSWILLVLGLLLVSMEPAAATGTTGIPEWEEVQVRLHAARDSVDAMVAPLWQKLRDRGALADGIGRLLFWEIDYQNGPARQWSDPNTVEWLILTDDLSDTISARLHPLLKGYVEANPEEILTEGRQAFELANMTLVPPPTRMLGFHITRMGRLTFSRADTLIAIDGVTDVAGVHDGFLRLLWDWLQQYDQFHSDVVQIHMSRIVQEDWIITRLKPNCPDGKHWRVAGQYMAMDLEETLYKHRFILRSKECDEELTIEVPLPHFKEYMEEVNRLSLEEQEKLLEEKIKYR